MNSHVPGTVLTESQGWRKETTLPVTDGWLAKLGIGGNCLRPLAWRYIGLQSMSFLGHNYTHMHAHTERGEERKREILN